MRAMSRRRCLEITAGAACLHGTRILASEQAKPYVRANTDWLAKCRDGIDVHWTAETVPRKGKPRLFQKAVDAFDVKRSFSVWRMRGPITSCSPQPTPCKCFPPRIYTTHQDYWSGELVDLNHPPTGRYHLANGLQWFGWTCLEDRAWVHHRLGTEIPTPLYSDEEIIAFVRTCNGHQAPMTFNVGIYQDGTIAEPSVEQLHRLGGALGSKRAAG